MRVSNWRDFCSGRLRAITFIVAGVVFLLVALLGDAGGGPVFFVLALAFVALALRDWQVGRIKSDGSNGSQESPLGGEKQLP